MSRNALVIDAAPEAVWSMLCDARRYRDWVVGAREVRVVEGDWPAPGSSFGHRIGLIGPLTLTDETRVSAADPGSRLVLRVEIGLFGSADVELVLEPDAAGSRTTVRMREKPSSGPVRWFNNPLQERAFWLRNLLSLIRLKVLVERLAPPATGSASGFAGLAGAR